MYAIIFHAHQKLDRVARRHLKLLVHGDDFPPIRKILHFEAGQGPDNVKLKRSHGDQPWHFVDPHDTEDTQLEEQIQHHYDGLVAALTAKDEVRAAFEAAWLAHALVDGLTPAHHYPYEKELEALRGGEHHHTRKGLTGRMYVKDDKLSRSIVKSFKLVGPRGLLTSHAMFEAGAYSLIAPLSLNRGQPTDQETQQVISKGVLSTFRQMVQEVASYKLYERFVAQGWNQSISRDVRLELAPRMVKMITLAWYAASQEAGLATA